MTRNQTTDHIRFEDWLSVLAIVFLLLLSLLA